MCGLVGFAGALDHRSLAHMAQSLAHRGPDAAGEYVDEATGVHLGHRRLSIVDIATGEQPMLNETGDVVVIFNGEIYNHVELRRELQQLGHRFQTDHSDTEVLIHGFEEWRENLPGRLNGMFAFAIYDRIRRKIFLARDRFGEKPLFYAVATGFFGFASELQALARHPAVDRSFDHRALQKFFAYGYLPAPNALLRGARKLPAGHWLHYDLDSRIIKIASYWRFSIEADERLGHADEPRLIDELEHLLRQAVVRRTMSDVPLGVFLSGGIDSSVIVSSLASSTEAADICTFNVGFQEPSFDELNYARAVAELFGTQHRQEILDFKTARELVPDVLAALDEPMGDASILPTYLLCRFARRTVKVALSGDGGDELFAGYDPFAALKAASLYAHFMPGYAHRAMRSLAELLPRSTANMSLDFRIRRVLRGLSYPASVRLPVWMSPLEPAEIAELFEEPLPLSDLYSEAITIWESSAAKNEIDRALEFFTTLYLQDDRPTKSDRASMQCSLEVRADISR